MTKPQDRRTSRRNPTLMERLYFGAMLSVAVGVFAAVVCGGDSVVVDAYRRSAVTS